MFETLEMAPPDAILGLTVAYNEDLNPEKINLGVGIYKDAAGHTPVLTCVKAAELRHLETESTKAYMPIDGSRDYAGSVQRLMFGPEHEIVTSRRAVTAHTPGGTGGLRVAADLLRQKLPGATVWLSKPTWANHAAIFDAAGVPTKTYAYHDPKSHGLDFEGMLNDLQRAAAGDVVLLHGCCHNPSGIDPAAQQWKALGNLLSEKQLLPLVDFAYQGFGDGLTEDAAGLLELCRPGSELLVCSSFSKNFGLYRERVGALTVVAADFSAAQAALSHVKRSIRCNYSNPPNHGAAVVTTILEDTELTREWLGELAGMRDRINGMRQLFVQTMQQKAPGQDFTFITGQRGMFSFSGLTPVQVDELKSKHSIYIVGSGRINVAGMNESNMDRLCTAIASVL